MKILVTGANGFLGRAVVAALLEQSIAVRALIRSRPPEPWGDRVEIFNADLCGDADLRPAFEGVAGVIHLAADLRGDDAQRMDSIVNGTRRLLQAMAQTACQRITLAGSFSVYDWSRIGWVVSEQSPVLDHANVRRYDSYALAKVMQEQMVRYFAHRHRWNLTILRPGAIWGKENAYLPDLGLRFKSFHLLFAPHRLLRLTYVENCAQAFVKAATMPEAIGQVFNVTDGHYATASGYLKELMRRTGMSGRVIPVGYSIGHFAAECAAWIQQALLRGKGRLPGLLMPRRYEARFKPVECDSGYLRRTLSWTPRYSYEQSLDRAFGPVNKPPQSQINYPQINTDEHR